MTHQPVHYYTGTIDTLTKIIRAEGFRVLWSGLTPALCVSIPTVIIYFTSYMKAKQLLGYNERSPNPILPVIAGMDQRTGNHSIFSSYFILGACSRVFAVTAVSPFELVRTKMQSEKVPYRQIFRLVRISLSEEGPRVLWRGLLPTLWRDIPFSMIYWFNYETFRGKRFFLTLYYYFLWFLIAYLVRSNIPVDGYATFACGALAGGIAATLTTPADVAKTYRQIELGQSKYLTTNRSTNTLAILSHILRVEGLNGLFAGM
jgi:solute carrier family 25 protein 39/40